MKNISLKTILLINLFLAFNCKAQTTNDYVTFYNDVVPKLNSIVPNKTQLYGQNFSNFYNELQNKNLTVVKFHCTPKTDPGSKFYVLKLFFEDNDFWSVATNNTYQYPYLSITFENEIPNQIKDMILQNQGQWNGTFLQFFLI